MLTRALHAVVARPAAYDAVQFAAGAALVRRRLARLVPPLPGGAVVIDVGAGTGLYRTIWPSAGVRYVCLDLDELKLRGFRARHSDAAVRGDAARLPFAAGCADAVACTLMSHHLDEDQLTAMLREVARVLKPGGTLLFADPLWRPARLPGRLLWRYDRGAHPRTAEALRGRIAEHLRINRWIEFALWHRYAACAAVRP
jgi:ubiquinone/menaquinone biosynthesis C-methylase UbiE